MAASILGAFANPLDNAAETAARVAAGVQAGGFTLPPYIGQILSAVSVRQDPATATANAVAAPSPVANDSAAATAAAPAAGWRVWLTGWRLGVVIAGAVALGWFLLRGRRRG